MSFYTFTDQDLPLDIWAGKVGPQRWPLFVRSALVVNDKPGEVLAAVDSLENTFFFRFVFKLALNAVWQ